MKRRTMNQSKSTKRDRRIVHGLLMTTLQPVLVNLGASTDQYYSVLIPYSKGERFRARLGNTRTSHDWQRVRVTKIQLSRKDVTHEYVIDLDQAA